VAQRPKEAVRARIFEQAALTFAERGFVGTTIAEIARRASVSTGNVYSYAASKEALFAAVVPASVLAEMRALLAERLAAAGGTTAFVAPAERARPDTETSSDPHGLASTRLLSFVIAQRLAVGIALVRAAGSPSPQAEFAADLLAQLLEAAERWLHTVPLGRSLAGGRGGSPLLDAPARFALARIYGDLLRGTGELLLTFDDEASLRRAVADLDAYHLAGLQGFFAHLATLAPSPTTGATRASHGGRS
jgi:AcrR family transcriptional regulator